jgi:V/A-type H+-transporting ATPase subunit I
MEEIVEFLHSMSMLHVDIVPEDMRGGISYHIIPLQKDEIAIKEKAEKILKKLKDLMLLLYQPSAPTVKRERKFIVTDIVSERIQSDYNNLEVKLRDLHKRRGELTERLSLLERYERILKGLAPLISKLSGFKNIESTGLIVDKEKAGVIPLVEVEISRITQGGYQIFKRELDEKNIGVILTYQKEYDEGVRGLLSEEGISEIKLPSDYAGLPFFDALKEMVRRKEEIPKEISDIETGLNRLSDEWYWKIEELIDVLKDLIEEFKTLDYCTGTKYCFFIFGWVPKGYLPKLSSAIKERFEDRVVIRELEIMEDEIDEVPVSIKNPKFIKPFEVFMRVLPPPRYDSIDPTPFLAIFFPVFFGLILGDIGHGLVILIIVALLWRKFKARGEQAESKRPVIQDLLKVFFLCSIYTMIFGFLFGEFFGELGERFGLHPIIFNRGKAIKGFLILAIGIGIGHVLLGFVISLINSIRWHKRREIIGTISSIAMLFTLFLLIAALAGYLPKGFLSIGIILTIVLFPIILLSEGIIGAIELIKSIGNILSYARLMALGVASVMMTLVANKLGEMMGNIILGIIVASVIHALNIAIGIFSPAIQSLRLHYVEFFSKFYKPGGRRYAPFKKTREGVRLWRRL